MDEQGRHILLTVGNLKFAGRFNELVIPVPLYSGSWDSLDDSAEVSLTTIRSADLVQFLYNDWSMALFLDIWNKS